jgi:hypothetical protein
MEPHTFKAGVANPMTCGYIEFGEICREPRGAKAHQRSIKDIVDIALAANKTVEVKTVKPCSPKTKAPNRYVSLTFPENGIYDELENEAKQKGIAVTACVLDIVARYFGYEMVPARPAGYAKKP